MLSYNPAVNGSFEAKVWECLRRNPKFLSAIKFIRDIADEDERRNARDMSAINARDNPYRYAEIVFKSIDTDSEWNLNKTWPSQKPSCRDSFRGPLSAGGARVAQRPPVKKAFAAMRNLVLGRGTEQAKDDMFEFVWATSSVWHESTVIAFPSVIHDTKHYDNVLSEIKKLLPSRKSFPKERYLKPSGKTLGSETEWKSFLLYEHWSQLGFDFEDSTDLIARELYGRIDVREKLSGASDRTAVLHARKVLASKKAHRNCFTVRAHVGAIRDAIENVFPKFCPFPNRRRGAQSPREVK